MHYYALVVVPDDTEDITAAVAEAMAPHQEDWDVDPATGFWDWYVIGGRYTGRISGYIPADDPINYAPCRLCAGSGVRGDDIALDGKTHLIQIVEPRFDKSHRRYGETGWCNGCDGTGMARNFSNAPHAGDAATVADVTDSPYTLVTAEGAWHREEWTGTEFADTSAALQAAWAALAPEARIVVVDYHS